MKVLLSIPYESMQNKEVICMVYSILEKHNLTVETITIPQLKPEFNHRNLLSNEINHINLPNVDLHISMIAPCKSILPLPDVAILVPDEKSCSCKHDRHPEIRFIWSNNLQELAYYLTMTNNSYLNKNKRRVDSSLLTLVQNSFLIARLMLIKSKTIRQLLLVVWACIQGLISARRR